MKTSMLLPLVLLGLLAAMLAGCKKKEPPPVAPAEKPAAEPAKPAEAPTLAPPAKEEPKPAPEPTAEPAPAPPEPTTKPAEQPEAKPKPAPKPEAAPQDQPQTKAPPAAGKEKSPWADAKVGAMVKMKGMQGMIITQEVVAADAETVTIKMTMEMSGMDPTVTEQKKPRYVRAGMSPMGPAMGKEIGTETIQIGDKAIECKIWEMKTTAGEKTTTTRTYFSQEVTGWMVKIESDAMGQMQTMQEIVEFRK